LRAEAYRSFIALLRANMRHAGGLRIDHVMSLQQLYWIPHGLAPSAGAYVRYPLEDLLGILALESERHRCLVVGEDLGTVPPGFRERMAAANVLSYRVLSFERTPSGFVAPEDYPRLAVAVAGSHDLPTLRSWWNGRDLELKRSLQLFPTEADRAQAVQERERDHADLLRAFRDAGLIDGLTTDSDALLDASHRFLAASRAAIALVQMDDITDESTPVNVPTTRDEHPNWRRRLSHTLEAIDALPRFAQISRIFAGRKR
jgi:4-alpha-glucanotransferase